MPSTKRPPKKTATTTTSVLSGAAAKQHQSLLEDYDKQVGKQLADIERGTEALLDQITKNFNLYAMGLPKRTRDMPVDEFFKYTGDSSSSSSPADATASAVQSAKEAVAESVNTEVHKELQSTRKRAVAASTAKKRRAAAQTPMMAPPPSTAVRRSTRQRAAPAQYETPATRRGRNAVTATPSITPKFDYRTPLPPSAMRLPKPSETLISMSGSPVYMAPAVARSATARKGKKGKAAADADVLTIPLGQVEKMVLADVPLPDQVELDDQAREKIRSMRSKLDKMMEWK